MRRLLRWFLVFSLLVAAALLTFPWWGVWPLRRVLASQGVTFARLERPTYARFRLHEVHARLDPHELRIAQLECEQPLSWLARALFSQPRPIAIRDWQLRLDMHAATDSPAASVIGDPADLHQRVKEIFPHLCRWLPSARAEAGLIVAQNENISFGAVEWNAAEARLVIDQLGWREHLARVELRALPDDELLMFTAAGAEADAWNFAGELRGARAEGKLSLWRQVAALRAEFHPDRWIPRFAEIIAEDWSVPAEKFRLCSAYARIGGALRASWREKSFTLEAHARSEALPGKSSPPLRVELAGRGDAASLAFERVEIQAPGVTARLRAPIVIDLDGEIRSGESVFSLEADLGKFPGAHSQGQIAGEIVFEPDRNFSPKLTARLTANGVFAFGLLVKNLELEATQSGAELAVGRARLALAGDAKAEISGRYTWRTRTLTEVAVRAQLNSTALAPWLPPAIAFSALALEARVHGSLDAPVHEGKFSVDALEIGTPRPILSSGEWSGVGAQAERVELSVQTGDTRASAFGQITRAAATIRSLELLLGGVEKLQLARPTLVRWQPSLDLGPVELLGETTSLFAAWQGGAVKRAKFTATRFDSRWLRDLTSLSPRAWQIESLDFSGAWPDGRLLGVLKLDGVWSPVGGKSARFSVAARSDDNGIEVERFLVSDDGGTVAQAGGRAPLAIRPETEIKLAMLTDARWSLELKTTPDSPFWAAQAAASGVIVRAPKLTARIEGAAQNPEARLQLQAAEVSLPRRPLPPLTEVAAELALGDRRLVLEKFSVLVAGQPLSATGRATLPAAEWSELLKNPRALWTGDAEARVRLPSLQIASLREFLPDVVVPSGTLAGDFAVNARGEIEGALTVRGASTHPVSPFGSFREIGGEMVFDGRRAELKTLHAQAGGQPVELRGAIAFPKNAPLALDVSLVGKNLSLARETGLLVRGDLDLTLKTAEDGTTTIGGAVNMHDSLFLRDVRSLMPARGGGAANRPPYFSVTRAPFRDWRLAVKVSGERFMKVRTPLFDGAISGDIKLGGTLREPLAIGAITVAGGAVRLPFAALEMRGGAVRLMQADPFSPQLDLEAEGRAFGYDLRMAINGPASEPALTFSSSPALSYEQVLLMVMAGETPRNEIVFSGTQRARRFGTYLGRGLISDLFGGGSAADRLSISSGENVTESGRETYTIEYELGRHWTAVGEYDKFDDYNLGLKWRIFSPKRKDPDVR